MLLPDLEVIIINAYRPFLDKNAFLDQIIAFIAELKDKYPKHDIICAGDFNVDLTKQSNYSETLIEQMISHGFIQQVTLPTRPGQNHSSLIDHVYTRSKRKLRSDIVITDLSDHYPILTTYPKWRAKREKIKITKRWFTPDSYDQLQTILAGTDWSSICSSINIEESTKKLESIITEAMDIVAPVTTKILSKKPINQWLTLGLKISLKESNNLYRKWRKTKNPDKKVEYKKYKNLLDKLIRISKNDHYESIIKRAGPDTRKLWLSLIHI